MSGPISECACKRRTCKFDLHFIDHALMVCWVIGCVDYDIPALDPFGWSILVIYAIGAKAFSQFLWLFSVGRFGIAVASIHINPAALYVMVIMVVLGATGRWEQAAGAALVAIGAFLAQQRARKLGAKPLLPLRRVASERLF